MPIISRFFGIIIYMFWRDHRPPHFHAKYGDDEIVVEIETGKVSGAMSPRAIKLIQEWRQERQMDLMENWRRVEEKKTLLPIRPLE